MVLMQQLLPQSRLSWNDQPGLVVVQTVHQLVLGGGLLAGECRIRLVTDPNSRQEIRHSTH